jgi:hypothetical protein
MMEFRVHHIHVMMHKKQGNERNLASRGKTEESIWNKEI